MKCKRCGSARSIEVGGEGLICFDCYTKTVVKAEREANARIAETITDYAPATDREIGYQVAMAEIATAIRKRGSK